MQKKTKKTKGSFLVHSVYVANETVFLFKLPGLAKRFLLTKIDLVAVLVELLLLDRLVNEPEEDANELGVSCRISKVSVVLFKFADFGVESFDVIEEL